MGEPHDERSAARSQPEPPPEPSAGSGQPGSNRLLAGRIGRPHGLDGSFHVVGARVGLLVAGARVWVADRPRQITRRAGTDARPILRLEGSHSREQAEALRGEELWTPRSLAPVLGEQEWWAEELEGCRVHDGDVEVGVVRRLIALPSCEVLEVRRPGRPELLVPMVGDALRAVDVQARRIEVDLRFLGADR